MKPTLSAAVIMLLAAPPALAHRLDEYLQGTILSLEKDRLSAQITLTPGVAVFPLLIADMDVNADGAISQTEQHAYAERILRDLSISIDGHPLTPHLVSLEFPAIEEMKDGRGEIQIEFQASFPPGSQNRKLIFENRHQSRIAAYQVNSLVPRDPDIRILAQKRNYSQSFYELDFTQAAAQSQRLSLASWLPGTQKPLAMLAVLLFAWLAVLWRRGA